MAAMKWMINKKQIRSWRFYCARCYGIVYYPQPNRSNKMRKRECPYPLCPWCGAKMDGVQEENA